MTEGSDARNGLYSYGLATIIVGISLFELFALFHWGRGTWLEKLSALLALIGVYGIALGLFVNSVNLAKLKKIGVGLTDPNPLLYISSNCFFCSILLNFGVLGLQNRMECDAPRALSVLGLFVWLPVGVLLLLYAVFHIFVIAFLAYVPLVISSAVIVRMKYAAGDCIISFGEGEVSLKSVVRKDTPALKAYVMGIPVLALSVISAVVKVIW
ncbi:hypothetical protein JYT31_00825 [Beggiatoa alba]|nr:hypothetical protein [Beggiatoa alba]